MDRYSSICIIMFLAITLLCSQPVLAKEPYVKLKSLKQLQTEGVAVQTRDYSCGAAALSILFKDYFEDPHEESVILEDILIRLSKEDYLDRLTRGFSMLDLKKSAERFGYNADGIILLADSVAALKGPVIILLVRKQSNHFVVLKGADGEKAYITDPIRGHLRMPLYELFSQWSGETLAIGREGFGLPVHYKLSIVKMKNNAPEKDVVRVLQRTLAP